jgi:hypothetical protein
MAVKLENLDSDQRILIIKVDFAILLDLFPNNQLRGVVPYNVKILNACPPFGQILELFPICQAFF